MEPRALLRCARHDAAGLSARVEGTIDLPLPVMWDDATRSLWASDWRGARLAGRHGRGWLRLAEPGTPERVARALAALHRIDPDFLERRGPERDELLESVRDDG